MAEKEEEEKTFKKKKMQLTFKICTAFMLWFTSMSGLKFLFKMIAIDLVPYSQLVFSVQFCVGRKTFWIII
jgi:hypothetical protein